MEGPGGPAVLLEAASPLNDDGRSVWATGCLFLRCCLRAHLGWLETCFSRRKSAGEGERGEPFSHEQRRDGGPQGRARCGAGSCGHRQQRWGSPKTGNRADIAPIKRTAGIPCRMPTVFLCCVVVDPGAIRMAGDTSLPGKVRGGLRGHPLSHACRRRARPRIPGCRECGGRG